jgi:hypothetical protein
MVLLSVLLGASTGRPEICPIAAAAAKAINAQQMMMITASGALRERCPAARIHAPDTVWLHLQATILLDK